jgi:predicted homoserine dehydrogenase-like protein
MPYHVFDFEIDISGARVVVAKDPLMVRCLSDGEIDANVKRVGRISEA